MADQYSENDANTEASRFLEWPDFLVIGNYFFLFLHSFLNKKKQKLLSSKIVAVVLAFVQKKEKKGLTRTTMAWWCGKEKESPASRKEFKIVSY